MSHIKTAKLGQHGRGQDCKSNGNRGRAQLSYESRPGIAINANLKSIISLW